GRNEMLGLGGLFQSVREKSHIFSETVSTLKSAIDLQQSFNQLQDAEKNGLDEAQKSKLEELAASKGLRALWKGSKLEVEGKRFSDLYPLSHFGMCFTYCCAPLINIINRCL